MRVLPFINENKYSKQGEKKEKNSPQKSRMHFDYMQPITSVSKALKRIKALESKHIVYVMFYWVRLFACFFKQIIANSKQK